MRAALSISLVAGCIFLAGDARAEPTHDACIRAADHGQAVRDDHHLIEARADFVICSAESCPMVVRKDCAHWLEEIDARMPNVVVSVRDEMEHDVTDVKVLVDDKPFPLDGARHPVNPGEHVFRFLPAGRDTFEEKVLVREGESNRLLTVHLPAPHAPATKPVAEARPVPVWTFVLGGVAVAGGATFGILAGKAKGDLSDLRDGCGQTHSCMQSDIDSVNSKLLVANIALGIGVVALAGAIYTYFVMR